MIAYDLFGSQQAVEFIRDIVDADGFYDRKEWFFKNLADTTVLAACAPAGGGRNVVSMRTISHFINFALPDASDEVLHSIFNSILHGHLTYVDISDPRPKETSSQLTLPILVQVLFVRLFKSIKRFRRFFVQPRRKFITPLICATSARLFKASCVPLQG